MDIISLGLNIAQGILNIIAGATGSRGVALALVQRILDMAGNIPPDVRDALERYGREGRTGPLLVLGRIVQFGFWLCVGAVVSTLGGLLGAAIFRKPPPPPPPGTIDVTTPSS